MDWEPIPGDPAGKVCRMFAENGSCRMPTRLMCEEWERRVGHLHQPKDGVPDALREEQARNVAAAPNGARHLPVVAPPAADLLATPADAARSAAATSAPPRAGFLSAPEPRKLRPKDVAASRMTEESLAPVPAHLRGQVAENEAFKPAKWIEEDALRSLEAACEEVTLSGPSGDVTIVPALTGRFDRVEITVRDAATLRLLVDAFPGAHVTSLVVRRPEAARVDDAEPETKVEPNDVRVCAACGCRSARPLTEHPCERCGAVKKPAPAAGGWDDP